MCLHMSVFLSVHRIIKMLSTDIDEIVGAMCD